MTSAFHRRHSDPHLPPGIVSAHSRRVTMRLHPALTDVINALEGTPIGRDFKDRAVEVSTPTLLSTTPIDHTTALAAHRWMLERAADDGLPLTAAGYLKPADVKALAGVLPTMRDWIFPISREIDAHPVLHFRERMKADRLLRTYKGTLRVTSSGRRGLADATHLWRHLAQALVPTERSFAADASVVILVHAATTAVETDDAESQPPGLDVDSVAATLTALGWSHPGGEPVGKSDVYGVWNRLWAALGNVGEQPSRPARSLTRTLSPAARRLIHDALFEELPNTP